MGVAPSVRQSLQLGMLGDIPCEGAAMQETGWLPPWEAPHAPQPAAPRWPRLISHSRNLHVLQVCGGNCTARFPCQQTSVPHHRMCQQRHKCWLLQLKMSHFENTKPLWEKVVFISLNKILKMKPYTPSHFDSCEHKVLHILHAALIVSIHFSLWTITAHLFLGTISLTWPLMSWNLTMGKWGNKSLPHSHKIKPKYHF